MNVRHLDILVCPSCGTSFSLEKKRTVTGREDIVEEGTLSCGSGHVYQIIGRVPRFVESDEYAGNFSFEWHKFRKVQLDIFNGTTESEDTFRESTGWTPEDLKGKRVLDVGIGAGRFSEVVSRWGGDVIGIDLSESVDAAQLNLADRDNVTIIQANVFSLPFRVESFDFIFSIGVLHHTRSTREAFEGLIPLLKPSGQIAVWLYAKYFEGTQVISDFMRRFTVNFSKKTLYALSWVAVPLYWLPGPLRTLVFKTFQLSLHPNPQWRWLDTFDWFSPVYCAKHTYPEVVGWFKACGLVEIDLPPRLLSVRGRKPSD